MVVIDEMLVTCFHNISKVISAKVMDVSSANQLCVTKTYDVWEIKRGLIYELLRKMADILKEYIMEQLRDDNKKFEMLYFTQKTHANIALAFRDINEAVKVLKNLKYICDDFFKLKHKMHVYNQLGYCYRVT